MSGQHTDEVNIETHVQYLTEIFLCLISTKIVKVNLSVFVYRLFHEDFSPIVLVPTIGEKSA